MRITNVPARSLRWLTAISTAMLMGTANAAEITNNSAQPVVQTLNHGLSDLPSPNGSPHQDTSTTAPLKDSTSPKPNVVMENNHPEIQVHKEALQNPTATVTPPAMPQPANMMNEPKILKVNKNGVEEKILQEPINVYSNFSIMLDIKDMETVITPGLTLYDSYTNQLDTAKKGEGISDDLTGLLESLKVQNEPRKTIRPLPNLYLGSIVYYSPTNWSIWVNGKKLTNTVNKESNAFYLKSITRSEVVLVWKPSTLQDMEKTWQDKTQKPAGVILDSPNRTLTLTMRPNQTFIPNTLEIREGLIPTPLGRMQNNDVPSPASVNPPPPMAKPFMGKSKLAQP